MICYDCTLSFVAVFSTILAYDSVFMRFDMWKKMYNQVSNLLFDLAGMLCRQFNIHIWKFLATSIGKAVVKVSFHICWISWYSSYSFLFLFCNHIIIQISSHPSYGNLYFTNTACRQHQWLLSVTTNVLIWWWKGLYGHLGISLEWHMSISLLLASWSKTAKDKFLSTQVAASIWW